MLLALISCRKDPTNPAESQSPVFYVTGNIDGFYENIIAGAGNYYMSTRFYRSDSILHLDGKLSEYECSDCLRSFEIIWAEDMPSFGFDPELHFSNQNPILLQPVDHLVNEFVEVKFYSEPNPDLGSVEDASWTFSDGSWVTQLDYTHLFPIFDGQTSEVVRHNMSYAASFGNCSYSQENTIELESECHSNFTFQKLNDSTFKFSPNSTGVEPAVYEWKLEDTVIISQYLEYTFEDTGAYDVELTVKNLPVNCLSKITKRVLVGVEACEANWHYTTDKVFSEPSDTARFGKVFIVWTDALGTRFQSDLVTQDSAAFFIVDKAEPYGVNKDGDPVMRIEGRVNCQLRAVNSGKKIRFTNVHFSMGLAYPEN